MRFVVALISAVSLSMWGIETSVFAQDQQGSPPKGQGSPQPQAEEEQPTPAPLAVSSMVIASNIALSIEAMAVDVTIDRVTYDYKLKNKGPRELSLAASVAQPDLEVNNDGSTIYVLPSNKAENVIDLDVKSNGKPIATTPAIQAVALGFDRRAALSSAGIPLIPFGDATDSALAGAKPETIIMLEGLGLITPRDPSQPNAQVVGDWSLRVVHGWTQTLAPNVSTDVNVSFSPIKAVYTIDASSLASFDALKDAACLTPQFMSSVRAMVAAKGSTADVADILIANDGAARWLDNPAARVAIHKPTSDSLVSFCGQDPRTQRAAVVTGTMPNSSDAGALRVLIFARTNQQ